MKYQITNDKYRINDQVQISNTQSLGLDYLDLICNLNGVRYVKIT